MDALGRAQQCTLAALSAIKRRPDIEPEVSRILNMNDEEMRRLVAMMKIKNAQEDIAVAGQLLEVATEFMPFWGNFIMAADLAKKMREGNVQLADMGQGVFMIGGIPHLIPGLTKTYKEAKAINEGLEAEKALTKCGDKALEACEDLAKAAKKVPRDPYHHLFPQQPELAAKFAAQGIDIDEFTVQMPRALHIDIHRGGPLGGRWNEAWRRFFTENPNASSEEIFDYLRTLVKDFGLPEVSPVRYPRR